MADLDNYYKVYYVNNKDRINAARRRKYSLEHPNYGKYRLPKGTSKTKEYQMWLAAKGNAKRQDLPFNLDISDIVIPKYCPILGIRLKLDGNGETRMHSPSLDKVIPEKGYVKGNVCVISFQANRMKQDLTIPTILRLYDYMKKNYDPARTSRSLKEIRSEMDSSTEVMPELPELDLSVDESLYESDLFNEWKDSVLESLDLKDQD